MSENNIVDSDCLGRYFSDSAPECKICRDAVTCRKQTIAAGYYVAPATPAVEEKMEYTIDKIVEMISKIGIPGCKASKKKVSIFNGNLRYLDVLCQPKAMLVYCSYPLSGLEKYSDTDARPYRGKIVSYETLNALLINLDSVRK